MESSIHRDSNSSLRSIFRARVPANVSVCSYTTFIQVSDIATACKNQKSGKATGPDDMAMKALTNGTYRLFVHLAISFNLFINFNYLPNSFIQSIIVPLVKNKAGDLSDLNNYRAIALSPVLSKLFEGILARFLGSDSTVNNHQFALKQDIPPVSAQMFLNRLLITMVVVVAMFLLAL